MKKKEEDFRRAHNFYLYESTFKILKALASIENRAMSDIVEELCKNYAIKNKKSIFNYTDNFWKGTKNV